MLVRLAVKNFVLIDELELHFSAGLTVVTGETGSGKSIVIDALSSIFGSKVGLDVLRSGNKPAILEAEFHLTNEELIVWLKENDLIDQDDLQQLLCKRVIDVDGKNKIYINGFNATSNQIRQIGEFILDIHTQHTHITLLKTEMQRKLLDEYAGISLEVEKINYLSKEIKQIIEMIEKAKFEAQQITFKINELQIVVDELSALNFDIENWSNLQKLHKQAVNANNILQELSKINEIFNGSIDNSSLYKHIKTLNHSVKNLEGYGIDCTQFNLILNSLEIELVELENGVANISSTIDLNIDNIDALENKIKVIFDVSRKYRINPEQIPQYLEEKKQQLLKLGSDINFDFLETRKLKLQQQYTELANKVTEIRHKKSLHLSRKVSEILHKLSISGEFKIELTPNKALDYPPYGFEIVEYLVGFNAGLQMGALSKIASGGELSRTALALYLLLSIHNPPELIIFDEIDVGISGKVAAIVGNMLHELGKTKQIICITHQPQTASFGDAHLVVNKQLENKTKSLFKWVTGTDRVSEIARMLGGINVSQTSIDHAKELLKVKNLEFSSIC